MQLNQDRPRAITSNQGMRIDELLTKQQMQRMGAAEAALVICGSVSDDEVFTSDVLDVAGFIVGDDVVNAAIVCGYRDGELECCLNDGHASIIGRAVDVEHLGHVTSSGDVFNQEVF